MGKAAENDIKINSKIKLYLKYKNIQNKKFKSVIVHESIFEKLNFHGLKGKKEAIIKKNYETPLVTCFNDGQLLIDETNRSIDQHFYMPIKVYDTKIDKFFENDMKIYWFHRQQTKNMNKMKTNFLIYLDENKKAIVELENCVYWFNSNLSYLS